MTLIFYTAEVPLSPPGECAFSNFRFFFTFRLRQAWIPQRLGVGSRYSEFLICRIKSCTRLKKKKWTLFIIFSGELSGRCMEYWNQRIDSKVKHRLWSKAHFWAENLIIVNFEEALNKNSFPTEALAARDFISTISETCGTFTFWSNHMFCTSAKIIFWSGIINKARRWLACTPLACLAMCSAAHLPCALHYSRLI